MERLISLFREPADEQWAPSQAQTALDEAQEAREEQEPLYYQELLRYLREQSDQADTLVGA